MTRAGAEALPAGAPARLAAYLRETYPLPRRAVGAVLIYGGLASLLAHLHGRSLDWRDAGLPLGSLAVFVFVLVLRLMDGLKDVETDRSLFPSRPLPSGRVHESDLAALLWVAAGLFLLAHVGSGWALVTAALALGYAGLMFRWFFAPERMRPDLPLTLATHNPVVPLLLLHLVTVYREAAGLRGAETDWAAVLVLVGGAWTALFAWEIARKIRAPEEEDAYVTYSRLLGPARAVVVVLGAQTASLAAGLWLSARYGLSPTFPGTLAAGYGAALAGAGRFLAAPSRATSKLRPYAEILVFAFFLGGLLSGLGA